MNTLITNYILPLIGIVILFFCILSFIFPYGKKFKGKIQKINAFGVNIEVSVLTLFIIIGVCLSLLGLYIQIKDYEGQLYNARIAKEKAERQLADAGKSEITLLVTLEDVEVGSMPKLEDISCRYHMSGVEKPQKADVLKGYLPLQFKIVLRDIKTTAHIMRLVLEDHSTNRKWVKQSFAPFEPNYQLKKE